MCKYSGFDDIHIVRLTKCDTTYFSSSDWSTLDFLLMTSPMCCNSPQKCTPVKYKKRKKAGFSFATEISAISQLCFNQSVLFYSPHHSNASFWSEVTQMP